MSGGRSYEEQIRKHPYRWRGGAPPAGTITSSGTMTGNEGSKPGRFLADIERD
jgi:hypothetical protein